MCFITSSTSSIIIWAHSGHLSSPWCFPQATSTSFPSGQATQCCFPVAGPTNHLKMTRPPGIFFFWKPNLKENGVQTAKCIVEGEVWRQDYKLQTLVYPRSQNIEAWMVKTMSAGCVNTVVACWKLITSDCTSQENWPHVDQKQEINFVWPNSNLLPYSMQCTCGVRHMWLCDAACHTFQPNQQQHSWICWTVKGSWLTVQVSSFHSLKGSGQMVTQIYPQKITKQLHG